MEKITTTSFCQDLLMPASSFLELQGELLLLLFSIREAQIFLCQNTMLTPF